MASMPAAITLTENRTAPDITPSLSELCVKIQETP
jgi:hypothetical protein